MRINRLALQAFGPFADRQDIDFEALTQGGIFLFEGPTGSGKSSVLDAITFALYGKLSGPGGDKAKLHSDFAPEETPEVTLEFTVSGRDFKITRVPEHRRPKKRGDGWTTEKSSVLLFGRAGDGWELISSNAEEVGIRINREIGLNREQFGQVVLLPQGDFARFLRADDDERREVLTRLFGAGRFDRMTAEFERRAQVARAEEDLAKSAVHDALTRAKEAGDVPVEVQQIWAPDDPNLLDLMRAHLGHLRASVATAESQLDTLQPDRAKVDQAASDARDHRERIADFLQIRAALDDHRASSSDHNVRTFAMHRADQAEQLRTQIEALSKLEVESLRRRQDVERLASEAGIELSLVPDAGTLDPQAKQLSDQAASLGHLLAVERGLPVRRTQSEEAQTKLAAVQQELAQSVSRQQALARELDVLRARHQELAGAAGRLSAASAEVELWDQRREAVEKVADLTTKLAAAGDSERDAIDAHQGAREAWQGLVQTRIDGMAGELAAGLEPGEPCSVCGATEHPAPAAPAEKPVDQAMVDAAHRHSARLEEARKVAGEVREGVAAELTRELALTAGLSAQQIQEGLRAARADLQTATDADQEATGVEAKWLAREEAAAQASQRVGTLTTDVIRLETDQRNTEESLRSDELAVTEAAGDHPTVAARVAEAQDRAAAITALAAAIRAAEQIEHQRLSQVEIAAASARSAGFETLDDAQSALLAPDAVTQLRSQVEAWAQREQKLSGQLEGDRLAGLGNSTAADLQTAREAEAATILERDRLEAEIRLVTVERDTARTREDRFGHLCADVETALAALHAEQAAHKPLLELDRLTRGMAGARRMTLTTYVLRYWFAQVVTAANLRLARMSGGKYELSRNEAGSRQGARVGLGLTVFDRYTGKERSPGTLSGGETFYTSLALALGLADVVQAEAGGVSLETLFIDEGFGTLDRDTLEQVLTVIDGLRDNGRVVGIVSHVLELKERLPERLEIRRTREDGPSTVHVIA